MTWTELVDACGSMIFRTAFRILNHAGDAEDVVQEVLLEAFRRYQKLGVVPEPGLLRRMATLRSIDQIRKRKPIEPLTETAHSNNEVPWESHDRKILANQLQRAIRDLPDRQAECFLLRHMEGLSLQQISVELGISISAVSTALHKAKLQLRFKLGSRDRVDQELAANIPPKDKLKQTNGETQ